MGRLFLIRNKLTSLRLQEKSPSGDHRLAHKAHNLETFVNLDCSKARKQAKKRKVRRKWSKNKDYEERQKKLKTKSHVLRQMRETR